MPQKWEIAAGTNMTQQWRMRLTKFLSTLGRSELNQAANIETAAGRVEPGQKD